MHSRSLRSLLVAYGACLVLSVPVAFGENPKPVAVELPRATLYDTEVHTLASKHFDQEYRLLVALPRGYADSTDRYPVLYVLDADILFGTVTETARLLPLEGFFVGYQVVPDLVLVGIAYPQGFQEMAAKRGRDLTPTSDIGPGSDTKSASDGAALFFRFLQQQAIPFIDKKYRTDPRDRGLLGSSAGGTFALDTLLRHPGTFHRYIATSPRMDEILFRHEAAYAKAHEDLRAVLYLSAGTVGEIEGQIAAGVERFRHSLLARNYPELRLVHESLEGENHVSAQPTAFTHGLKAAYAADLTAAPEP